MHETYIYEFVIRLRYCREIDDSFRRKISKFRCYQKPYARTTIQRLNNINI